MAAHHEVKQGEHLIRIANAYGFSGYRPIWDHPENAALKKRRTDPNILYPGDVVYIPDRETKQERCVTGQRHRFRLERQPCLLRLVLKDIDSRPIANTDCTLQAESEVYQLVTDSGGLVEQAIPKEAEQGKLIIPERELALRIGHLDPANEPSGQQGRLNNLGYFAGPPGQPDEEGLLRSAIEEFQCDQKLPVSGACDAGTLAALLREHGS